MDKELQKQFSTFLKTIKSEMPADANLSKIEKKLDKLIELQEKQLKATEQTLKKLNTLIERTEDTNEYLGNISINTSSL